MSLARIILPCIVLLAVAAPSAADPLVEAEAGPCNVAADPIALWGPRARASCTLPSGKTYCVYAGPGPVDAPEVRFC